MSSNIKRICFCKLFQVVMLSFSYSVTNNNVPLTDTIDIGEMSKQRTKSILYAINTTTK